MSLDLHRVLYECSCGSWRPLSYFYYCKECAKFRCPNCTYEELESSHYCTSCLDSTNVNDARSGYCSNCYLCPVCGVTLSQRATTDGHFLHCSHCMWTTNDEGLGTRAKAESWTLPANPMQAHFNEINSYLKNLSTKPIARTTSDLPNTARKSLSNMSSVVSDKYGFNKAVQKRSQHIFQPVEPPTAIPSSDVPGLDPSIFTQEVDPTMIPKLDQDLAIVGQCNMKFPIRKRLASRCQVRCPEHDLLLYRAEYNVLVTTPKNHFPCAQFCPEVKLSREVDFSESEEFSVFLTIANWTPSSLSVTIVPLKSEDPDWLLFSNAEPIQLSIPKKDGTAIDDELVNLHASYDPDAIGSVVFMLKHRVGIHLKCRANRGSNRQQTYLILKLCYHQEDKPEPVFEERVKVLMDKPA